MAPVLHETAPRAPVRAQALARALVRPGGLWSEVRVVAETGSTNADLAEAAQAGADEGLVLLAETQRAGRGRLGRSWQAPSGAGLTLSALLRPRSIAAAGLGWLPLLTGVAVVEGCTSVAAEIDAALKWPNDLLVRPASSRAWGKCGGILAELVDAEAIVVGIGINVWQDASELPDPIDPMAYPPTSLALAGASADRERLAVAVLQRMSHWYSQWRAVSGDPERCGLVEAYRAHCQTLGRPVMVRLPGGVAVRGTAADIDRDGRLVVRTADGEQHLAAGDVHHLRDAS